MGMSTASLNSLGDLTALLRALRPLPPGLLGELAWAFLGSKPRSLAEDAQRVLDRLYPPPRVEGLHFVPARDPFLLVANHFQSEDLWIGWVAAAITAAIASVRVPYSRNLHWVVLSEWRWLEIGGRWIPNPISSLLFPRAADSWGLISMPSRPSDVGGRAAALRKVLAYLGRGRAAAPLNPEPVGIFPEGRASAALEEARPGTGAFLHRVSSLGVALLPVGVHQEGDLMVVRFGEPFGLGEPPPGELDDWARGQVMSAIGRLLPREMWGAYSHLIEPTA